MTAGREGFSCVALGSAKTKWHTIAKIKANKTEIPRDTVIGKFLD